MPIVHSFLNPSSRWYYPLRWLVLILLGLAIYSQTFGFGFVFDDNYFMLKTNFIRNWDKINQIWAIFPKTRMVGIYSFALNYHFNQLHPQGYHVFNFITHLVAVGLVWALADLLFKITKWLPAESQVTRELPFIIGVLFLVHPCQTQAVTYITQRFESMATVFYLGSIYSYLRGRIASSTKHKIFLFTCSAGFAILGILTKEVAATIPLMILAVEFIFFNKDPLNSPKSPSKKLYLLITILAVAFVLLFIKIAPVNLIDNTYLNSSDPSESHDGDIITGGKYLLTQTRVFLTFLRLLILPIHQNADYDYPLSTGVLQPPLTMVGLGVIGFMTFLIFKSRKQWPLIAFGLAWILITFSINTAPRVNLIFEHKLYLISFGFFLAAVCALSTIIKDRKTLFGILITLIAILSLLSYARNQVWKNDLTLWNDVIQKSPHKARGYNNRGFAYYKQGQFIQAMADFNKAIELNLKYADPFLSRGVIYVKQGKFSQAFDDFSKAIEISPGNAEAYNNLGNLYIQKGDVPKALFNLNKTIELNPYHAEVYYNRGLILRNQGQSTQAISDFTKAIEINPGFAEAYLNRSNLYVKTGDLTQALSDLDKIIDINPNYAEVYFSRGNIYYRQNDLTQAIADYTQAIALDPRHEKAYTNLIAIYLGLNEFDHAWDFARKAKEAGCSINPELIQALKNSSGHGTFDKK